MSVKRVFRTAMVASIRIARKEMKVPKNPFWTQLVAIIRVPICARNGLLACIHSASCTISTSRNVKVADLKTYRRSAVARMQRNPEQGHLGLRDHVYGPIDLSCKRC